MPSKKRRRSASAAPKPSRATCLICVTTTGSFRLERFPCSAESIEICAFHVTLDERNRSSDRNRSSMTTPSPSTSLCAQIGRVVLSLSQRQTMP